MSLTARLALQQLKKAHKRTAWTLAGIGLSVAMIVATNGFAASAMAMFSQDGRTIDIWERIGFLIIAAILGGIIAIASIIVISNAFRVSAVERIRQFGILKSVGATKKQISATVMYEAMFLSIIGVPVGIMLGILTQFIATAIANQVLSPLRYMFPDFYATFMFVVSPFAIALASAGAFVMILISAWLPARKAANAPAVTAIMGDIKIKHARGFGLSRLFFGFEGQLAASQLKRSRRNFRASVVSIAISIVMLLAAASAQVNLMRQIGIMYEGIGANVRMNFWTQLTAFQYTSHTDEYGNFYTRPGDGQWINLYDKDGNLPGINPAIALEIAERLREFPGADVRGHGRSLYAYEVLYDIGVLYDISLATSYITLVIVDEELYSQIVQAAGVPHGSNILLNVGRYTDIRGITHETTPHSNMVGMTLSVFRTEARNHAGVLRREEVPDTRRDIYIHGQITSLPDPMLYSAFWTPTIIVQDMRVRQYEFFIQTDDTRGFIEHANYVSRHLQIVNAGVGISPLDNIRAEREVISNLATVFVGGFVGMLTLIGVTNVISTISTNTKLRKREFAILASVGMTRGGMGKMLALESILCSVRALVFGLPLGALAAYGVYYGTQMDRVRFSFIFPWQALIICIIGVFVITFVTTMFSAYRLRNENIIEAIR